MRRNRWTVVVIIGVLMLLVDSGAALATVGDGSYAFVSKSKGADPGAWVSRSVACPAHDIAVGGGAYWHAQDQNGDSTLAAYVIDSAPKGIDTGWTASGENRSTQHLILTVQAQCLPTGKIGTFQVKTHSVSVPAGKARHALALCTSGDVDLTGGVMWRGESHDLATDGPVTDSASFPQLGKEPPGWFAMGLNGTARTVTLTATAVCIRPKRAGASLVSGAVLPEAPGATDEVYASCSAGERTVTGGEWWTDLSGKLAPSGMIESSAPTADASSWYASGRNGGAANLQFNSTSVCVTVAP